MKKTFVPLMRPTLPPLAELIPSFKKVYETGQLTNNRFVADFEKKASKYLGIKDITAVGSGTDALLIALLSLEKKGQVIIPSFDFSSPMHSLTILGFEPVLIDIDRETFNLDVRDLVKKINKKTVAIMAPHIFGNPCDIDEILNIAKNNKLKVIFDGAHAFGSMYKGNSVAKYGDFCAFSLTPTKVLAIGEGGLLAVGGSANIDSIKSLRSNGDNFDRSLEIIGISSRMTEWQAIIGLKALRYLKKNIESRTKLVKYYKELFSEIDGVSFQKVKPGNFSVYQNFAIVLSDRFPLKRDALIEQLKRRGIETKAYFSPLHQKMMYRHLASKYVLKNTDYVSARVLSLPFYSHITLRDVKFVVDTIKNISKK